MALFSVRKNLSCDAVLYLGADKGRDLPNLRIAMPLDPVLNWSLRLLDYASILWLVSSRRFTQDIDHFVKLHADPQGIWSGNAVGVHIRRNPSLYFVL